MYRTPQDADRFASHLTETAIRLANEGIDLDAEIAAQVEAINALPISAATKAALIAQNAEIARQAANV